MELVIVDTYLVRKTCLPNSTTTHCYCVIEPHAEERRRTRSMGHHHTDGGERERGGGGGGRDGARQLLLLGIPNQTWQLDLEEEEDMLSPRLAAVPFFYSSKKLGKPDLPSFAARILSLLASFKRPPKREKCSLLLLWNFQISGCFSSPPT